MAEREIGPEDNFLIQFEPFGRRDTGDERAIADANVNNGFCTHWLDEFNFGRDGGCCIWGDSGWGVEVFGADAEDDLAGQAERLKM